MTADQIRSDTPLLIIDDFTLNRECLVDRLTQDYAEVRSAWDLPSLLREVDRDAPRVILLNFATRESVNLLQFCLDMEPQPKVIAFGLSEERDVTTCAEAGASGLHLRSESFEGLAILVREVRDGNTYCSPEVSSVLLGQVYSTVAGGRLSDPAVGSLTTREFDILLLVEEGLTNQQIASRLSLTVHTVKNHVHSLLSKLGVTSRAEAARVARATRYAGSASARPKLHAVSG